MKKAIMGGWLGDTNMFSSQGVTCSWCCRDLTQPGRCVWIQHLYYDHCDTNTTFVQIIWYSWANSATRAEQLFVF